METNAYVLFQIQMVRFRNLFPFYCNVNFLEAFKEILLFMKTVDTTGIGTYLKVISLAIFR